MSALAMAGGAIGASGLWAYVLQGAPAASVAVLIGIGFGWAAQRYWDLRGVEALAALGVGMGAGGLLGAAMGGSPVTLVPVAIGAGLVWGAQGLLSRRVPTAGERPSYFVAIRGTFGVVLVILVFWTPLYLFFLFVAEWA